MRQLAAIQFIGKPAHDRFLVRSIAHLRWVTIAALLLISLTQPSAGRTGLPEWALVAIFAGYNLLLDLLRSRIPDRRFFACAALLDLPAVGLVYFGCPGPGGPLFTLLVLAAVQTAAFMTLPGTLLYSGALATIALVVEPSLPGWTGSGADFRAMSARLVVLGLVGVGMGTLTRRLDQEQDAAQSMLDETTRLEGLDRLRADFVASVSHDLRTPLTAARAALILLDASIGGGLRTDERALLANGRRNIERLGALIDDLLVANRLDAETLRLDRTPLDLRTVVAGATAAVYPLIEGKEQTLELELHEPLPCAGDPSRLEQIFLNLLANAHLHSPPGTRIHVSGRRVGDEIRVLVSDEGPGIPSWARETIFQRFYRLSGEGGGSGLGLAITRALVELHGGGVWAESRPGGGTTFHVALPCWAAMEAGGLA